MNNSNESERQHDRWILFIHQLPPQPDYLRVRVRRQLQKLGAVLLKNSVYVLPMTPACMEDFQWLRRDIAESGGEVMLVAATFVEGLSDGEVEARFREASEEAYAGVAAAVERLGADPDRQSLVRVRRQLQEARTRDFFGAAGFAAVLSMIEAAERGPERSSAVREDGPRGATWVTRSGVEVDRMASAWLIRRFIDSAATFRFVAAQGYAPGPSELRFDMFEGEYTHEQDRCTFETLVHRFGYVDDALRAIGEIVHDIDCKDGKFERDETEGIRTVLHGIVLAHDSDGARLQASSPVFDALYEHFGRRS